MVLSLVVEKRACGGCRVVREAKHFVLGSSPGFREVSAGMDFDPYRAGHWAFLGPQVSLP